MNSKPPIVLPEKFIELLRETIDQERYEKYLESFSEEPVVSFRINPEKWSLSDIDAIFPEIRKERVKWCKNGFYLDERPSFTMDPLFHAGVYYAQEASSMYIEKLIDVFKNKYIKARECNGTSLKVLDLCAAPGGKSTHLLSLFEYDTLFVLNEAIRSRAITLADNVAKWGYPNVVVTNNDAFEFEALNDYFDLIVADVPCSGEGMFRKDNNAIKEWSYDNVMHSAARQRRIISDIWPSLKTGGYLIYSTCTFNNYENENNIKWICSNLGAEPVPGTMFQFIPGVSKGEGFFCSMLLKTDDNSHYRKLTKKVPGNGSNSSVKRDDILSKYIIGDYRAILNKKFIKAYPKSLDKDMLFVESHLRSVHSGVLMGELISARNKPEQFIPHADLALSTILNKDSFFNYDLSYDEAIKFLSLAPLTIPSIPRDYILLTYKNIPLGFIKNLDNRTNNLWPKSRRIFKQ